jgi:PIN domain nuclease of toxin-antitoxin system
LERAAEAGQLHLSVISVWEIAMLEAKGRLAVGRRCESWVEEALEKSRVRLVPLDPTVTILSTRLEGFTYGDPADRMLAATVLDKGWRLVTADQRLIRYLESKKMPVLAL